MRTFSRRGFLQWTGGLVLAAAFPGSSWAGMLGQLFSRREARPTTPITPNDEFYGTSYRSPPTVRVSDWSLSVKGLVSRPTTLTYHQLLTRPTVSQIVTLECIGNTVGGEFISTAEWEGVPLQALLDEAGVSSRAVDVVFHAADGYSDSISVERAQVGDVLVALRMNGVPLPLGHGFPARIIVPGAYGMKSVQWLTEIEMVERNYKGYYQNKGWTDDATVYTMSRIDVPRHGDTLTGARHLLHGIAFAGTRGIQQVELSTEGGGSWQAVTLAPPLSLSAWRLWTYEWTVPRSGHYDLMVRATDGLGRLQTSMEQAPAPAGATGLDVITVKVKM